LLIILKSQIQEENKRLREDLDRCNEIIKNHHLENEQMQLQHRDAMQKLQDDHQSQLLLQQPSKIIIIEEPIEPEPADADEYLEEPPSLYNFHVEEAPVSHIISK
jgi:hypothetical protein